jgi:hypothetical protein
MNQLLILLFFQSILADSCWLMLLAIILFSSFEKSKKLFFNIGTKLRYLSPPPPPPPPDLYQVSTTYSPGFSAD